MKKFQSVRGMRDILPKESKIFRLLEQTLINLSNQYGYEEIRTPILEDTNLFIKSIGDGTDIVEKEMYTFKNLKENSFSMRPEGTASCARALIEHGLHDSINKLWYLGPFFRHERPQKGRYRQFHQFGIEFIGVENFEADIEIISLANSIWQKLNIKPILKINTIGDIDDRKKYTKILIDYFNKYKNKLNDNEKSKIDLNPIRILDSKNPNLNDIIRSAPKIKDYISKESNEHFENLLNGLEKKNILYQRDDNLVRGLDYYNRTVFEYLDNSDNSQNTICAGGRYDLLFESLCEKKVPALGFAIGLERLLDYIEDKPTQKNSVVFYIAVMNQTDNLYAQNIAELIRKISENFSVLVSYNYTNLKVQLKKADKLSVDYCVIIGEEESKNNSFQLKNMNSGQQEMVLNNNIEKYINVKCMKGNNYE
jgi:histidyl-tRNA synthetase